MDHSRERSLIMIHILEVVLSVPPNSVIHLALAHEGYVHPLDFLTEKDETLDGLEYPDHCGTPTKIPGDAAWLLKIFRQFIAYQNDQGIPYGENYWTDITNEKFNTFRRFKGYDTRLIIHDLMPVCPSSVDVFDSIHELHGGDIGTKASTSVHEDMPEPTVPPSLSLESFNVKTSFNSSKVHNKTVPLREPKAPAKQQQMDLLPIRMNLPVPLLVYENPKNQQANSISPCLQDLCSNFDFLDSTSALDVSPAHSDAPVIYQNSPVGNHIAPVSHPSHYMMHDNGETTLHATAMELDSLLYFKYGEYVLDEVTIMLELFFDSVHDKDLNKTESLNALDYKLKPLLVTLGFEQDTLLKDTLAKQLRSSYGNFLENEVHYLQTALPGNIEMMESENFPNCMDTKPRPPPSPNILVSSRTEMPSHVQSKISILENGNAKLFAEHTLEHHKLLAMNSERNFSLKINKPPCQVTADSKMCLEQVTSILPPLAPNIWIAEEERVMADGEIGCADHHILQGPLNWLKEAPNYGESTTWFDDCSCIGYFFRRHWKEKKVYTAHVGWENGENPSYGVQRGVTEFVRNDLQNQEKQGSDRIFIILAGARCP